jgi:hypothetical protein
LSWLVANVTEEAPLLFGECHQTFFGARGIALADAEFLIATPI